MTIFSSKELKLAANDQDEYVKFFQGTRNAQLLTLALFTWFGKSLSLRVAFQRYM
jgi:hypothetical protein